MQFCQTPIHVPGHRVNTVIPGSISDLQTSAPRPDFMTSSFVFGFVDRCLSRTRNIAASNKTFRYEDFLSPMLVQDPAGKLCFRYLLEFRNINEKISAHSERYRILPWISLEYDFLLKKIVFPLASILVQTAPRCGIHRRIEGSMKQPRVCM